jgi:hypothetical protein
LEDYTPIKSGKFDIPDILPHEWFDADIDLSVENPRNGADYYVNIRYFENGKEVCLKQFKLDIQTKKDKFIKIIGKE